MIFSTRLIVDSELLILEAESAFETLCGHSVETLPGVAFDELLSPRDRRGTARLFAALASSQGGWIDILVTLSAGPERAAGGDCPVRLRLTGHAEGWLVVLEDLEHDGNALFQRLSAESEQWRSVARGSADGMAFMDRRGHALLINDRFLELLPLTSTHGVALNEEGILGRDLLELLPAAFDSIREVASRSSPYAREATRSITYLERELEVRLAPTIAPGRGYLGAGLTVRDVTAEREVEVLRLEHARSAGMAELATSVLHNIGNATNSVQVAVDALARELPALDPTPLERIRRLLTKQQAADGFLGSPKGEQLIQYLDVLHKRWADGFGTLERELEDLREQTQHIREVIGAQQERAAAKRFVERVDLHKLVETSLKMARLDNSGLQVGIDGIPEPVWLETDRHGVIQIVVNLLTNARNAVLDVKRTDPRVRVVVREAGQWGWVEVCDNGCGVPPELQEKIFQHGFTTRSEGHGFGLHNAVLLAKELGGALEIESEGLGRGARFRLSLPLAPAPTPVGANSQVG